ncbi:MAG TPA: hypothetical protein VFV38_42000 [Ktedonobacteraceae bacterium]|nr:hypothetical protein [Ktedonobacteraceae bacterium]
MHDADRQETKSEPQQWPDEFDVELSDLPPATRSHHLLLRLHTLRENLRTTGQAAVERVREATQEAHQEMADEFDVEFSDLPPTLRSHYRLLQLLALKERLLAFMRPAQRRNDNELTTQSAGLPVHVRHPVRARVGKTLSALGLCATLLVLLLGNAPDLRNRLFSLFQPSPSASTQTTLTYSSFGIITIDDTPVAGIQRRLERHPATCPQTSTLQNFDPPLAMSGLGGSPLWVTGFTGSPATLVHLAPAPVPFPGWYQTMTFFIKAGTEAPILLQGGSQAGNESLAFSDPESTDPISAVFTIDLNNLGTSSYYVSQGEWEVTAINLYLPRAGCYSLQANWAGGTWTVYFAAGR